MKTISEQITDIRKSLGLSQAELGAILGKTAGAICNYEKGRRPIRAIDFETLKERLAKKNGALAPKGQRGAHSPAKDKYPSAHIS